MGVSTHVQVGVCNRQRDEEIPALSCEFLINRPKHRRKEKSVDIWERREGGSEGGREGICLDPHSATTLEKLLNSPEPLFRGNRTIIYTIKG